MKIKRIAVSENKRKYFIQDTNVSFNTNEGEIPRTEMNKDLVETSINEKIHLYDANFKDNYVSIKKSAATINPKDAGMIIAYTNLTKNSIVIDAGAGSGALSCMLASLCKKVYSYDINNDSVKLVNKNIQDLELDNITCELKDIYNLDPMEKVDLMTIDVPEPEKVLNTAKKALKNGGYLVLYTPQINQAQKAIAMLDDDFHYELTCEIIKRDWEVSDKKLRPSHNMLGHTAFLTFIRFYPKKCKLNPNVNVKSRKEARLERGKNHKSISEEEEAELLNQVYN